MKPTSEEQPSAGIRVTSIRVTVFAIAAVTLDSLARRQRSQFDVT
jgi:hypothetical protein